MIRRPPRSTRKESSAASDVYKRQALYVIGFLLIISIGTYVYFRQRKSSSINGNTDTNSNELNKDSQPSMEEQQPVEEESQSRSEEEQQPVEEESQSRSEEEKKPIDGDENNDK